MLTIGLSKEHAQVKGVLDCKFDLLDTEIIIGVQLLKSGNFALDLDIFGRFLEIQHIVAFLAQVLQHRGKLTDQDATLTPDCKVCFILVDNYPAGHEL